MNSWPSARTALAALLLVGLSACNSKESNDSAEDSNNAPDQLQGDPVPLSFEANAGQFDKDTLFRLRADWGIFAVQGRRLHFSIGPPPSPAKPEAKSGPSPLDWLRKPKAEEELPSVISLLSVWGTHRLAKGRWPLEPADSEQPAGERGGVRFLEVVTPELWVGAEHVVSGETGTLSFTVSVNSNVDLGRIAWDVAGTSELKVEEDGSLRLTTARGTLEVQHPQFLVSAADGTERTVPGRFRLEGLRLGFVCPDRKKSEPVVVRMPSLVIRLNDK
ncbi:MAG: hypothetical protein ABGZ37_02950 [Akkermansiaceae bacterium]